MKNKKIISIILSISLTIGSILAPSYAAKAANPLHGVVLSKQGLNVRSESNGSSKIIGTLRLDDVIEILDTTNEWYKIKFASSYGYVSKQYIKLDKNASTTNTNTPNTTTDKPTTNTADKPNTNNTTTNNNNSNNNSTTNPTNTTPATDTKPDSNSNSGNNSTTKVPKYKNLDERKDVDKLKQWKAKFNKKIKDTEINRNQFKVVDSKGNFISTKVLIEDSSVTVLPWDAGYSYDEKYKLIIGDNIESDDGVKIKYTSTLPFTIKAKVDSLGLGKTETESISNDKSYDWYINQYDTGKYSNVNSGPAAIAMAIKWTASSSNTSTADIRDTYKNGGAAWSISAISSYLKNSNIKYNSCDNVSEDSLKKEIKNGNILIVNLNPQYINYNSSSDSKIGRFHVVEGNTYTVVIKGYKVIDSKTYFEIYDSFNSNQNNSDASPKGKNNYYPAIEVLNSLTSESIHPIIITK